MDLVSAALVRLAVLAIETVGSHVEAVVLFVGSVLAVWLKGQFDRPAVRDAVLKSAMSVEDETELLLLRGLRKPASEKKREKAIDGALSALPWHQRPMTRGAVGRVLERDVMPEVRRRSRSEKP